MRPVLRSALFVLACSLTLGACSRAGSRAETRRVIYGTDDRREFFDVADPALRETVGSSVALVEARRMREAEELGKGWFRVEGPVYGEMDRLCEGEPFREQRSLAFCSGVLVAPDVVLTAGHCVPNLASCRLTRFVFGLRDEGGKRPVGEVPGSDVYHCADILDRSEPHAEEAPELMDYALVVLNRPVRGHPVARPGKAFALQAGAAVAMAGYPRGIPLKVAEGRLRYVNESRSLVIAELDAYHSNSGSPVYDRASGELIGIVVDGEDDFVEAGGCRRSKICAPGTCRGETLTPIEKIPANYWRVTTKSWL